MAAMSPVAASGVGSPQPFLTDTDYENMPIHWNDCEDYEIIRKVGRGKYSEVFEGWKISTEEKVIIKCLKPVRSVPSFAEYAHRFQSLCQSILLVQESGFVFPFPGREKSNVR